MNTTTNKEELRTYVHKYIIPNLVWEKPLSEIYKEKLKEWKETYKINEDILRFYTNKKILFEMVKYLKNGELTIGENIRWLLASRVNNLLSHLFFYKVIEEPKSMYKGLTNFKNRPSPPYPIGEKQKWQKDYWTGEKRAYLDFIESYNFGLDLDAETFEKSYKDAKKVFNLFKKFNVRFSIWCSGKKGFHFIIPYEEFKELIEPFNVDKGIAVCKGLMLDLTKILKLTKVDSHIYSPTRYLKLPYSIDKRNNRVIFPLNDKEFEDFDKNSEKYMSIDYCLSQTNLGFRGAYCERESNPKGFNKMIDYIEENL